MYESCFPGDIPGCVRRGYDEFCKLRGKQISEVKVPFWDLVVLTTSDEEQKLAFELQIQQKYEQNALPLGVPFHVFPDPIGPKAGCGTSTMNICCILRELYGDKLDQYKILLINCGGQSQRLPSASILGKVFMILPMGNPALSLFEFKLFCYLPFIKRMNPGYLHVASDTIEVFDMGDGTDWTFERPGFTAVAHPSSLEIGSTHGVYVLKERTPGPRKLSEMRDCLFVLQKPSIGLMYEKGAVQKQNEDGVEVEFVYTDSLFFFDQEIARKFEQFYQTEAPFDCEIDGYADFLQSLGPQATIEFTRDLKNVSHIEPRLVEIREKVFHLLKGTPLHIISLNCSKFYHLGTMKEYIYNFCGNEIMQTEMGFSQQTFCRFISGNADSDGDVGKFGGCQIHSILSKQSNIAANSIVEFCNFPGGANIGENCIISNCETESFVEIPDDIFLHTVALVLPTHPESVQFSTILLRVSDDIKKKVTTENISTLPYMGSSLGKYAEIMKIEEHSLFSLDDPVINLWSAKLFPVCLTMDKALECALKSINALRNGTSENIEPCSRVSMQEMMMWKSPRAMAEYRQKLFVDISRFSREIQQ